MSDQEFKGNSPKSPAGESIFFNSLDYWIELCDCIRMIIADSFPSYPSMEAEDAEFLAELLERRLEFGLVRAYFELAARRRFNDPDLSEEEIEAEVGEHVETMLDWAVQYIVFLRECGGCEPV